MSLELEEFDPGGSGGIHESGANWVDGKSARKGLDQISIWNQDRMRGRVEEMVMLW